MIVHYNLLFLRYKRYFDNKDDLNEFIYELQCEGNEYSDRGLFEFPKTFFVTEDDGETLLKPKGDQND